jgi:hypothetical protein
MVMNLNDEVDKVLRSKILKSRIYPVRLTVEQHDFVKYDYPNFADVVRRDIDELRMKKGRK